MSELNFRILFVPDEVINQNERDNFLSIVKNAVESCGVNVVSINYSQIKKSEDEDYPEIEELCVQIQAKASYFNEKIHAYKNFCKRWEQLHDSLPYSYVVIYGNDYFKYPSKKYIRDSCMKFSFGVLPHNGLYYEFASFGQKGTFFDFYHDTRNVVINYDVFEIIFSYDNIRTVFISSSRPQEIFFDLFNPPLIFRKEMRTTQYGESYTLKHRNLNLTKPTLGRQTPLINNDVLGRANVLSLYLASSDSVQQILNGIHFHCSEKSVHISRVITVSKEKPSDPVVEHMHFGCSYLITAMIRRNFIIMAQAFDIYKNLRKLESMSRQNEDVLEKALTAVLSALDSGKILNFWHAIDSQYNYYRTNKDEINFKEYVVPSKCSMIRRIMLTPTRQLLWPKEIMYGNRVLRNYEAEYSLRVSFRDDNMSRMSFNAACADKGVLDSCIKNPMTSGIRIGSRHYEFLAWSNSQIRDHGVWMYARDEQGRTATDIRQWMGDFSHIHNVPKYMARMGQCFSQTEDALSVPLDPEHVRTENDIERGSNRLNGKPYCFSDGVGKISTKLAAEVHKVLGHDKLCSAFQIRYGGYKGMLVIDPTLKNTDIVFRNSMKKFDSPKNIRLEIAKTSAPVSLQLNRPFIALLNDLGVRHRVFLRLQEEMLKTLTDMLFNEKKASDFLRSKTPSGLFNYEDLSSSGIYLTTEPFFKSLLLALHRHHIENIKKRANIAIDPSLGRNMLGVIDETGSLEYGQVFVQYTTDISHGETTRETTIVKREVLVTKNPCLHPGDVRKFQAVDIPALHHIVDCIVFPQKGQRPHPNEMAGSDCDGDEYTVLWCSDLIFWRMNKEPADFPEVHAPDVPFIRVHDMIEFLQTYIKNDQVGSIANAHLAHATTKSIDSVECISIAKKFSVAVDFAKNGQSRQLERWERPNEFPDFMEKTHKGITKSKKALGKMYRVCKDFESENEDTSIIYQNIKVDPDLVYDGWENYKDNAVKAKNKYNGLFRSILRNYGIQHEAEALSGAFTKLHCRFQERKDRNEIEKVIIGCMKKLQKSMFEEFLEEFLGSRDISLAENQMLQKASAWYVMTYSNSNAKFLSFPWTVSTYLVNIKLRKTLANPPSFSPAIMSLDEKILECESKKLLPNYIETGIWKEYGFMCEPQIVKYALRTLILWAQEEKIVETPGQSHGGLMFISKFVQLFLHVAHKFGYLTKSNHINNNKQAFSSGDLCMEFLKFCSSFRFYNKDDIYEVLPFEVYKYSKLAKQAVVSYHRFALTGQFQTLYFDSRIEKELIQMRPIHIDSKIFTRSPIDEASFTKAEEALVKYSQVEHLSLREILQTKKVCVSAQGSEQALKDLKSILRKKNVVLKELFLTGIMPEKE